MTAAATERRGSIVTNFFYLTAGHGVYKLSALVGLSLLAHYLGSAQFGRFALAMAAVQLFEVLTDAGLGQALIREGAGHPDRLRQDLAAIIPVKLALAAVNIGLAIVVVLATDVDQQLYELTFWLAAAYGISSLTVILRVVFQAFERMEYEALSITMEGAARLLAIVLALIGVFGLVGIAKALTIAELVVFTATAVVVVRRFIHLDLGSFRWRRALQLVAVGGPFALAWVLLSADQRVNTLLVGRIAGDTSAAVFAAAVRLTEPSLMLASVLVVALFPVAVRHGREGRPTLNALLTASLKALIIVGLPIALLLWILAPLIIPIVFGDDLATASNPLRILAPAVLLLFVRVGVIQIGLALGRWRLVLLAQMLGLAVDVAVAAALIPQGGAVGAAVALLAGEAVAVAAGLFTLRGYLEQQLALELGRPLLAGVAAALTGVLLVEGSMGWAAFGACVTYVVAMRVVRIFSRVEWTYVRDAMPPMGALMSFAVRSDT